MANVLRSSLTLLAILAASPVHAEAATRPRDAAAVAPASPGRDRARHRRPGVRLDSSARSASRLGGLGFDAPDGDLPGALARGDHASVDRGSWWRGMSIGSGAELVLDAIVGPLQPQPPSIGRVARDGLGSPGRDPPRAGVKTVLSWSGRF